MKFGSKYRTKQDFRKYGKGDKKVWKQLYNRQVENLKDGNMAVMEFWNGLSRLNITDEIPRIDDVNKLLKQLNSPYQLTPVTGLIPDDIFFRMLREGEFPVTTWIRPMESIDYIEEPDMFHDLFGHVPFLMHPTYCHFLKRIGDHSKDIFRYKKYKDRQYEMSRLYWYTVEFGLVRQKKDEFKIYGSGILSSYNESIKALSNDSEKIKFTTTKDILSRRFEKDSLQEFYAYMDKNIKFLHRLNISEI